MEARSRDTLKLLFEQALALPPQERAAFLDTACQNDPDLHAELASLLEAYEPASDFFGSFTEAIHPHAAPASTDPLLGQTVSHYEILDKLGGGGMGVVYKARDTRLKRIVALKFLPAAWTRDPVARQRFVREAQAASALDHPNIGTIYEIGETEEGRLFIAMAYYAGETLKAKVGRGPLPVAEALDYAVQMARGLGQAHEAGIVHRDVKPANVMVTERGRVKVVDFGIAKMADVSLSTPGSTPGTVAYMSPEQARGEAVDHRTDLWSLGVVLYEMLTGIQPFRGDRSEVVLYAIRHDGPEPVGSLRAEVPEALAQVVETLLQKDPEARYQTAEAVITALHAFAASKVPGPPARGHVRRKRTRVGEVADRADGEKSLRRIAVSAGLGLAVLIAAVAFFSSRGEKNTPPARGSGTLSIAVLPFNVRGDAALEYLREGMPTLVSLNLDALTGLASVDYNALLGFVARSPDRPVDPELGREIARHFEADHFILGTVISVGGSTRLDAALYSAGGEKEVTKQVEMRSTEELQAAVDELTLGLVSDRLETPVLDIVGSGISGVPFAAITHYLDGEVAMRRGRWSDARNSFGRAVAEDSSFALGWSRLASSWAWGPDQNAQKSDAALEVAARLSGSLSPTTAALIKARQIQRKGYFHEADSLLRHVIAQQPNHPGAWYDLGDVIFHLGPLHGIPKKHARAPFEKALSYDPGNFELTFHLVDIALLEDDLAGADSLWDPERESGLAILSEAVQHRGWLADSSIVRRVRETLTEEPRAAFVFSRYPVFLEQAATLFSPSEGAEWLDAADYIRGRFAGEIQRLDEEGVRWGRWEPWGMLNALAFLPLPEDDHRRLAEAVANWRADTLFSSNRSDRRRKILVYDRKDIDLWDLFAHGIASWRVGDTARAHTLAETLLDRGAVSQENKLGLMLGYTLEAFLSVDDEETALDFLDKANVRLGQPGGGSYWYQNRHGRFLRAELLLRLGDYEGALTWYESLEHYTLSTSIMLGPRTYGMAQCLDALGRSAEAVETYARFIELWEEADPALQVMVDDARTRRDALRQM